MEAESPSTSNIVLLLRFQLPWRRETVIELLLLHGKLEIIIYTLTKKQNDYRDWPSANAYILRHYKKSWLKSKLHKL
jgi:hypothetical protein